MSFEYSNDNIFFLLTILYVNGCDYSFYFENKKNIKNKELKTKVPQQMSKSQKAQTHKANEKYIFLLQVFPYRICTNCVLMSSLTSHLYDSYIRFHYTDNNILENMIGENGKNWGSAFNIVVYS